MPPPALSSPTPVWTGDPTGCGLVQRAQLQLQGLSLPPTPLEHLERAQTSMLAWLGLEYGHQEVLPP